MAKAGNLIVKAIVIYDNMRPKDLILNVTYNSWLR